MKSSTLNWLELIDQSIYLSNYFSVSFDGHLNLPPRLPHVCTYCTNMSSFIITTFARLRIYKANVLIPINLFISCGLEIFNIITM